MSTSVELLGPRETWAWVPAKRPDETVWQALVTKGCAQGRRSDAMKWASLAGVLIAAGLWSDLLAYDIVIRFVLTSCAMGVMLQAFRTRRYAVVVVFGALALLYNPVVPAFSF